MPSTAGLFLESLFTTAQSFDVPASVRVGDISVAGLECLIENQQVTALAYRNVGDINVDIKITFPMRNVKSVSFNMRTAKMSVALDEHPYGDRRSIWDRREDHMR